MEQNLHEVRREIELARLALGEKVSRLEQKIETTKNTTLNPAYHVQRRPWATLGSAVAAGFFMGLLRRRSSARNGAGARSRERGSFAPAAANVLSMMAVNLVHDYLSQRRRKHTQDGSHGLD